MSNSSRQPPELTCPIPFEDDVLKDVINFEGSTCFLLTDDPIELKYPTTPPQIVCDPNDPSRKYLCYPIFPEEPEKSNSDTSQKNGK